MIETTYHYPGDPITPVQLLFGGEFTEANPNREIVITVDDGVPPTRIPVEDVLCDVCNAPVGELDPCALTDRQLYCWPCYEQWVKPYIVK